MRKLVNKFNLFSDNRGQLLARDGEIYSLSCSTNHIPNTGSDAYDTELVSQEEYIVSDVIPFPPVFLVIGIVSWSLGILLHVGSPAITVFCIILAGLLSSLRSNLISIDNTLILSHDHELVPIVISPVG